MKKAFLVGILGLLALGAQAQFIDYSVFSGYIEMTITEYEETVIFEMDSVSYEDDYVIYDFISYYSDFALSVILEFDDPTLGIGLTITNTDTGVPYGGGLATYQYELEYDVDFFQFTLLEPIILENMAIGYITLEPGSGGSVIFYP